MRLGVLQVLAVLDKIMVNLFRNGIFQNHYFGILVQYYRFDMKEIADEGFHARHSSGIKQIVQRYEV